MGIYIIKNISSVNQYITILQSLVVYEIPVIKKKKLILYFLVYHLMLLLPSILPLNVSCLKSINSKLISDLYLLYF